MISTVAAAAVVRKVMTEIMSKKEKKKTVGETLTQMSDLISAERVSDMSELFERIYPETLEMLLRKITKEARKLTTDDDFTYYMVCSHVEMVKAGLPRIALRYVAEWVISAMDMRDILHKDRAKAFTELFEQTFLGAKVSDDESDE